MQITKYIVMVVFVSHESEYEVVCITKLIKAKVVQSNDYIASRRNGIVIWMKISHFKLSVQMIKDSISILYDYIRCLN